jgi:hypothetical protein
MLKKLVMVGLIVLLVSALCLSLWAAPRDCKDCGTQCEAGSCDESWGCSQCIINGCGPGIDIACNRPAPM